MNADFLVGETLSMTERIFRYFREQQPETPCLVIDLPAVRVAYATLLEYMPAAEIFYAVKANPAPEILKLLADQALLAKHDDYGERTRRHEDIGEQIVSDAHKARLIPSDEAEQDIAHM